MARKRGRKSTRIRTGFGEVEFTMSDPDFVDMLQPVEHYGKAIKDWVPVWEAFSAYHRRSLLRNFASEGRPDRWSPLAASTIKDRLRQGFGAGPILERTGALQRGFRFTWRAKSYQVRNVVPYFQYHQDGTSKMPRRPMIVLLAQDKAAFTRLARKHLTGGDS